MKPRIAILTEIIAPYRTPVFNALAARDDVDLHVVYLSETDKSLREWEVDRTEIRYSYEVLRSYRIRAGGWHLLLTRGMRAALQRYDPHIVIAGGYNYIAMWQAQRWSRARQKPFLLWSESNVADMRRNWRPIETAKRKFIRSCQGFIVPGISAAEYLRTFKVRDDVIFVAPNAVDVERFSRLAARAREDSDSRSRFGLPSRFFLYSGRLVERKGVFDLLTAYATLPEKVRREIGLVFAGDGREREQLFRISRQVKPGTVVLTGFLQRNELAEVYAHAEALILPTYSDTWGLVVNEAIACGLPIIVTRVAGCAADLVKEGENGFVIGTGDCHALSQAMEKLAIDRTLREQMGACSLEISAHFTPQHWAEGVTHVVVRTGDEIG